MKTFILMMHMMVYDPELKMMRGITFFEPSIPKYKSIKACTERGIEIITKAKKEFIELKLKTGEFEIDCIEVKSTTI